LSRDRISFEAKLSELAQGLGDLRQLIALDRREDGRVEAVALRYAVIRREWRRRSQVAVRCHFLRRTLRLAWNGKEVEVIDRIGNEAAEERSLAVDIAAVATPIAIVVQPIVGAWADQHFGESQSAPNASPQPQEQPKTD
jgi:hypothetical protein